MPVVSHDSESVPDDEHIEILVEDGCDLWFTHDQAVQGLHCLKAYLHQLWLLVLHGKENSQDDGLEFLGLQLE